MDKEKKDKKKRISWQMLLAYGFMLVVSGVCGAFLGINLVEISRETNSIGGTIFYFALVLIAVYIACSMQIVVHEGGHLIFGLLSGYQFESFRIGSFMWMKKDGKLRLKRFSLAGTGGQCLMAPPDMKDGKIPFVLYNLGGCMLNIIVATLLLLLYFSFRDIWLVSSILRLAVVIGYAFAIINGVPLKMGQVNNDGHNALSLGKDRESLRAFWIQMKVNQQIAQGVRAKDLPEEWVKVPSDQGMKNSMIATVGVLACNKLMDAHAFQEADRLMARFLSMDTAIVGVHSGLLVCDRVYCQLISENNQQELDKMWTKEQKKFMKSMKTYPSVLRTEYAYALLAKKDDAKAREMMEKFEKIALSYPHPTEIENERELIAIAQKARKHKA